MLKRSITVVALLLVAGTACADPTEGSAPRASGSSPTEATSPDEPSPDVAATPSGPGCEERPLGVDTYSGPRKSTVLRDSGGPVSAKANIYAAGRNAPPAPGGGGGGELPPVYPLPAGASRVLSFPTVSGEVTPIDFQSNWNDAGGDHIGMTDVRSLDGISGIVDRTNGMFLVGVFLTDAPAANPAPEALDFSEGTDLDGFEVLDPEIGQVFLIGDGQGRSYAVPDDATRLFLGFADAYQYVGCPGWYANNDGELRVAIQVTTA
jgi:hypothetical protein